MKPSAGGGDRAELAWVAAHRAVHRRSLPEGLGPLHRLGWVAGITPREERPWSRLGILEAPKGWSFGDRYSSIQQGGGDYGVSLCLPTRDAFVNKAGPRTAWERQTSACGSELREATRGRMRRLSWGRSSVVLRTRGPEAPGPVRTPPWGCRQSASCAGGGMGCRMGEGLQDGGGAEAGMVRESLPMRLSQSLPANAHWGALSLSFQGARAPALSRSHLLGPWSSSQPGRQGTGSE